MFITRGQKGALVVQGRYKTELPAVPADVLDPTGAGDTFCGAALANLVGHMHPIMAARKAMALASQEIEHPGPAALLFEQPSPEIPVDKKVHVDENQIMRISEVIKTIPEAHPFTFVSDYYPPVNHPAALAYFFTQTLQQFSFWEAIMGRYAYPLIASIDGHRCKGSTYLSYAYMRPLEKDPAFYAPARQAHTTMDETLALFRADDGTDPMPALELHWKIAQAYGKDMMALKMTPQVIVEKSNASERPLETFLSILDHISGYKEDPLRKKSNLLAFILMQRPERFLRIAQGGEMQPVIDYHAMRFCLRTGLIEIDDEALREKIIEKMLITAEEEWVIRYACYIAIQKLSEYSGLDAGAVDHFTFSYTRQHCPEMTVPDCGQCALDQVCTHLKSLFQPVIRTTFY
jgi:hypothetical protein